MEKTTVVIETDRLILRAYKECDLQDLYEYLSNEEVVKYEPYKPMNMDEVRSNLAWRISTDEMIAVELKSNHKMIGNVYLGKRDFDSLELGYVFHQNYWRKGYAKESCMALVQRAFSNGIHRIFAECDPENFSSWKLLESLGFHREAHLRQNVSFWKDRENRPLWKDTYIYAKLETENREPTGKGEKVIANDGRETSRTLDGQVAFIREAEGLKSVLREAWTSIGRQESTAEHSWRLALLAGILASSFPVDLGKTLMMCLIHDLGELYLGDIPAVVNADEEAKHRAEERDVRRVLAALPVPQREKLLALWQEYNENSTPEAKLVKALDKAETILQHNQGENPPGFDYPFNLTYGKSYFSDHPLLLSLRELLDSETEARAKNP